MDHLARAMVSGSISPVATSTTRSVLRSSPLSETPKATRRPRGDAKYQSSAARVPKARGFDEGRGAGSVALGEVERGLLPVAVALRVEDALAAHLHVAHDADRQERLEPCGHGVAGKRGEGGLGALRLGVDPGLRLGRVLFEAAEGIGDLQAVEGFGHGPGAGVLVEAVGHGKRAAPGYERQPLRDSHPRAAEASPERRSRLCTRSTGAPQGLSCALTMARLLLILSGIYGFLAVALGAFGAHGLRGFLGNQPDGAQRLEWWHTAAHYHLAHALALGLAAWVASRAPGPITTAAGLCFAGGVVLFSGSLYAMTLTGQRWLGAVTPLGGLLLLAGWLALTVAAFRMR